MRVCTKCGRYGADADTQCQHCGADLVPSGVAAQPNGGRVRLIRFIGVVFIVVGALSLLVAAFVGFFLSTVGTFGSHQGPSQKPLPLPFYFDVALASIVTGALIVVGIGLIRLKPWARIGAILFAALGLYFSAVAFITFYFETTPLPEALPEPPLAMILVAAIFPPITVIFALLSVLLIVMLLTRRGRATFVSPRRKKLYP